MVDHSSPSENSGRHMGIELFRVLAMFLIVLLHVLGRGGVYANAGYLGHNYKIAWYFEILAFCSVNCYGLISGFVGIGSRFRFRKLIKLWLEVVFITVTTTALFAVFAPSYVVGEDWLRAFFPMTMREYWYFNAYMLMLPFTSLMNEGLCKLGKRRHLMLMGVLFVMTTLLPLVADRDIFALSSGYSCLWLMVLYVFGAYFRLYGVPRAAHPLLCLAVFFGATTLAWAVKVRIWTFLDAGALVGYTSPCMLIMALCLLCLFAKLDPVNRWAVFVIGNLGKATFGVFLFHVGAMMWKVIDDRWAHLSKQSSLSMVADILLVTLGLYLVSTAYSLMRILIFRVFRVYETVDAVADRLAGKKQQ